MLKKILSIKNIGLFNNANYTSQSFDQATLIYAENGRGKSTLTSILRSCSMGDKESVILRKTLGSQKGPEVELLFEKGTTHTKFVFRENSWTNTYTNIVIFDTDFVDRNVYSGIKVETNHRQGLLEFALGEDAVQLKKEIDHAAKEASDKSKEISNLERCLKKYRGNFPLEKFASLESVLDINQKISICQKRLDDARNNKTIQQREALSRLDQPPLNIEAFFEILAKTLESLEKNAEEAVQQHISNYSQADFEEWLSKGQIFEDNISCPYCGQGIKGNILLNAYKVHFNESYRDLQSKTLSLEKGIDCRFSDTIIDELSSIAKDNQRIIEQWVDCVTLEKPCFDKNKLTEIFKQIRKLFSDLSKSKQQNLFEKIGSKEDKDQAHHLWDQFVHIVDNYNKSISLLIITIEELKKEIAGENIQDIEKELRRLNLLKTRQEATVCSLIQEWKDAKQLKRKCEQNKSIARERLDSLMTKTLEKYQTQINTLLQNFGVLFQIDSLSHDYRGAGTPRSSYGLKVKGQKVQLSAESAPSFSTALSEGDKRTLAFAFFIARIKTDLNLKENIVVVDDPVCSLDRNRRNQTKRILRDIGRESAQLIVLGHDPYFLRDLRDALCNNRVNISTQILKINRVINDHSNFAICDIDRECASGYYQNHKILQDFTNGNSSCNLETVARAIRPLLEGYLHRRFPGHVQRSKLFGQIIGEAKEAQLPNPLAYLQPITTELYEINDYAGQFHHDTNASADATSINDSELRSYARRALSIVHKGEPLAE